MEAVPAVRNVILTTALAALVVLSASSPAFGKGCGGTGNNPPSSVAQYVEQVPTSCGSKATGTDSQTRKIPKAIEQKIDSQGGQDATLLKAVVSNSGYGAPTTKIKPQKKTNGKGSKGHNAMLSDAEARQSSPLAASLGVITDGSDARLIALVGMMLAIAAIVLVSALRRRRVTR
jgi:hypothetical protein